MKKHFLGSAIASAGLTLLIACGVKQQPVVTASTRISIFESEYGGYGYNVYRNDSCIIHQPHIPTLEGVHGFRTRLQAQQIGIIVSEKIERGEFPPTVTREELDSLRIHY